MFIWGIVRWIGLGLIFRVCFLKEREGGGFFGGGGIVLWWEEGFG